MRRSLVVALLTLWATAFPAVAQAAEHDWLVGIWEGTVQGLHSDRGAQRTLTVQRVDASGRIHGGWTSGKTPGVGRGAEMRVERDVVHVLTQDKHTVTLRRVAPDRLEGSFVSTGGANRTYPVVMRRRS